MKSWLPIYLTISLLLAGTILCAQHKNIRAQLASNFKRADVLFADEAYVQASDLYKRVVKKDSTNIEAIFKLAECLRLANLTAESEYWYSKGMKLKPDAPAIYKLNYAETLLSNGKNEEASRWIEEYSKVNSQDPIYINKKKSIEKYSLFYEDSLAYTVKEASINSIYSDFDPIYFEEGILFLSSREQQPTFVKYVNVSDQTSFLNLFYSPFNGDSGLAAPQRFEAFGYSLHEGPVTFFDKGQKAIISKNTKSGAKKKEQSRLSLFYTEKLKDGKWSALKGLPFTLGEYSFSHPYFDENTQTLYFVSNMNGGYGGADIYKAAYNEGKWDSPVNLGAFVNTPGSELFPFVSNDSCLYYASNGQPGMGGLDLFKKDLKQEHAEVENMGYPVNSPYDDFALIVDKKCSNGFFSSNRKNGSTDDNIYTLQFHSSRYEGKVVENLKKIPQKDALVKIIESGSGSERILKTNAKGEFNFYFVPGKRYQVQVIKESYKINSFEIFSASKEEKITKNTIVLDKYNKSFVKGKVMEDTTILANSKVSILDLNSDLLEIIYTDSIGEFQCEINRDTTNIFYIENSHLKGIFKLEPPKRKRKGSGVSYITVMAGSIEEKEISAIYLDSSRVGIADDTLYLKNELTNEEQLIVTGKDGKFSTKVWIYGKYKIFRKENELPILLETFIPETITSIEVTKNRKPKSFN